MVIKVVTSPANLGLENKVLSAKEKFNVAAEYIKQTRNRFIDFTSNPKSPELIN